MLGVALFQLTSLTFQGWPPHSVTIFKMRPDIVLYNWDMLLQSICLKDLRMRPSIEFAFLDADAVWCLNESSLSIHTPKSFSHVVSSSFTVCPVRLVIVYV